MWYGGGCDLTPFYVEPEDFAEFHAFWKQLCDKHSPEVGRAAAAEGAGKVQGGEGKVDPGAWLSAPRLLAVLCHYDWVVHCHFPRLHPAPAHPQYNTRTQAQATRPPPPTCSIARHPPSPAPPLIFPRCTLSSRPGATATSTSLRARNTGAWAASSSTTLMPPLPATMWIRWGAP